VHARVAQHLVQQVRRGVGHLAVLGEVGRALHVDGDARHAAQPFERAQLALHQQQAAQRRDARRMARLVERDAIAHAALHRDLGAQARQLAADVELLAVAHQGAVVSAGLDVGVGRALQVGGGLPQAFITGHARSRWR